MVHAFLQLRPVSRLPCLSVHHPRRLVPSLPAYAATSNDDQRPKIPDPSRAWDDHLAQQQQQTDNYRPPILDTTEFDIAKDKFLGRLSTLILGVRSVHLAQTLTDTIFSCHLVLHPMQAVLLGERITGHGAVEQLELSSTNIPLWEIEPVLGAVVLALTAAAFWPPSRETNGGKKQSILASWLKNITGRAACLGLAATITGEVLTGKVLSLVLSL